MDSHLTKLQQALGETVKPRGWPADKVRDEIGAKIAEMDAMIERCDRELAAGKFRGKAVLDHPVEGEKAFKRRGRTEKQSTLRKPKAFSASLCIAQPSHERSLRRSRRFRA